MDKIVVKPRAGVTVRHPESGQPIRDGQTVRRIPQIIRYINDGDLIVIDNKKSATKAKKESE